MVFRKNKAKNRPRNKAKYKVKADNEKIHLRPGSSLLFVCYGNTCRSPMAEGLAKKMFSTAVRVESAGINPMFEGAAEDAVRIMKEMFDMDISAHKTRHVLSVSPSDFDYVVAMDPAVHDVLKRYNRKIPANLILWRIEDPFSQDMSVYGRVVDSIHSHLQDTFTLPLY